MIRVWMTTGALMLSVVAAYVLTPNRPADGGQKPVLEDIIPAVAGDWRVDDGFQPVLPRAPEDGSLANRIYDQTIARTYRNSKGDRVMLVVAYGHDQSDTLQLHLPETCYASQGFSVARSGRAKIALQDGAELPVNRLTTRRGQRFEPVTYWTRVGGTISLTTLSRQWAKLAYGIRGRVPDGVLIRVSSISSHSARAFAVHARFIRALLGAVERKHLPFLVGDAVSRS